jgi:hypothetical protein
MPPQPPTQPPTLRRLVPVQLPPDDYGVRKKRGEGKRREGEEDGGRTTTAVIAEADKVAKGMGMICDEHQHRWMLTNVRRVRPGIEYVDRCGVVYFHEWQCVERYEVELGGGRRSSLECKAKKLVRIVGKWVGE